MIVQEAGVAVGWPLGLGNDTTGWPLGLRLRLTQEDLQWPRDPDLIRSPSYTSEDSSSLDTMSTRSFFQDKSISLGTLIGLPMDHPANRHHQQQQPEQHDDPAAFPNRPTTAAIASTSSSPVQQPKKAKKKQHHQSAASSAPGTPSAARSSTIAAGWNFLNVLSCARVPAAVGVNEAAIISIPRAQVVVRQIEASPSGDQDLETVGLREEHLNRTTGSAATNSNMQLSICKVSLEQQQLNSRGRKLYDNITFEDDVRVSGETNNSARSRTRKSSSRSSDVDDSPSSKELNPLFTCSSLVAQDEEDKDGVEADVSSLMEGMVDDRKSQANMEEDSSTTIVLAPASVTKNEVFYYETDAKRSSMSMNSNLERGSSISTSDSLDARKRHQLLVNRNLEFAHLHASNAYDSRALSRSDQDFLRNKAVSLFITRMVCCLSTPTRGSSTF